MAIKKSSIILSVIILLVIISATFYFVMKSSNYGIISGIVTKRLEPGMTGDVGFDKVYANATVEIYVLEQEKINNDVIEELDKPIESVKTDKDGEFSVKVPAGKYQVRAFYSDNLRSDDINVDVKMAKTSRIEIQLQEL